MSPRQPAEYGAGLKLAIERGWLWKHETGTSNAYAGGRALPKRRRFLRGVAARSRFRNFRGLARFVPSHTRRSALP